MDMEEGCGYTMSCHPGLSFHTALMLQGQGHVSQKLQWFMELSAFLWHMHIAIQIRCPCPYSHDPFIETPGLQSQ